MKCKKHPKYKGKLAPRVPCKPCQTTYRRIILATKKKKTTPKKKKPAKKRITTPIDVELVVVLDRSGSMSNVRYDMEGGLRQLIADQKKQKGKCSFTLVQFDDQYETVFRTIPIKAVNEEKIQLIPRGSTALNDALGRTINWTDTHLRTLEKKCKVIFVTITDGYENASREYNKLQISKLIKSHDDWEFVYLGANQDAIEVGKDYSFQQRNSMTFAANSMGTQAFYSGLSRKLSDIRVGASTTMSWTPEERKEQEDAAKVSSNSSTNPF